MGSYTTGIPPDSYRSWVERVVPLWNNRSPTKRHCFWAEPPGIILRWLATITNTPVMSIVNIVAGTHSLLGGAFLAGGGV